MIPERTLEVLATIRRSVLLVLAFGLPIAFLPHWVNDPYDVPKFGLLLAAVALATGIRAAEGILATGWIRARQMLIPVAGLMIPLTISWVASSHRGWALWGQYSRWQGLIPYLAVAVLGLLIADGFGQRKLSLVWALALSGTVVGSYSLAQSFGWDPFWLPDAVALNGSTIGNTNFTGAFLAITLPLCVYLWVEAPRLRMLAIPGCVVSVVSLVLVDSQGGWVAAVAALSVLIGGLVSRRWRLARPLGLVGAAALMMAVLAAVAVAAAVGSPGAGPVIGGTVRDRSVEWMTATKMAADSPFIGHGPNSYVLLGTKYRSTENALSSELWKADDPHSLPFAFLANNGLFGLAGIALIYLWVVRKALSQPTGVDLALVAAAVAYIAQSLVSIDEIPLRSTFWILLGALATGDRRTAEIAPTGFFKQKVVVAGAALVVGSALAAWSVGLILADARVHKGLDLFARAEIDEGRTHFRKALAFRDEYRYREIYSESLGLAALNKGPEGAPLIAEMKMVDAYLATFPETIGLRKSARILHYWARFEPDQDEEALQLIRRAREFDPNNPAITVLESQILVALGRAGEAAEQLQRYEAELVGTYSDYWNAYALALAVAGDHERAAEAYAQASALSPGSCRSVIIGEVLRQLVASGTVPPSAEYESFRHIICDPGFFHFAVDQMPRKAQVHYR